MFDKLPKSQSWFSEEPDILKPEPGLMPIASSMASQHVVINIMSFDGILRECVQKIGRLWEKYIKMLVHAIDQKSLAISN